MEEEVVAHCERLDAAFGNFRDKFIYDTVGSFRVGQRSE